MKKDNPAGEENKEESSYTSGTITPSTGRKKIVIAKLKTLFENYGLNTVGHDAPDSKIKQEFHMFLDELHTWDTNEDEYEEQIYEITGYC